MFVRLVLLALTALLEDALYVLFVLLAHMLVLLELPHAHHVLLELT